MLNSTYVKGKKFTRYKNLTFMFQNKFKKNYCGTNIIVLFWLHKDFTKIYIIKFYLLYIKYFLVPKMGRYLKHELDFKSHVFLPRIIIKIKSSYCART